MALALGYQRAGDLLRAKEYTMQSLAADPVNPVALKNLGAILGKEGDRLRALYYLRRSLEIDPQDPQIVYGLAFTNMELEAPEDLRRLARKGFREITAWQLKIGGPIHRDIRKSS